MGGQGHYPAAASPRISKPNESPTTLRISLVPRPPLYTRFRPGPLADDPGGPVPDEHAVVEIPVEDFADRRRGPAAGSAGAMWRRGRGAVGVERGGDAFHAPAVDGQPKDAHDHGRLARLDM